MGAGGHYDRNQQCDIVYKQYNQQGKYKRNERKFVIKTHWHVRSPSWGLLLSHSTDDIQDESTSPEVVTLFELMGKLLSFFSSFKCQQIYLTDLWKRAPMHMEIFSFFFKFCLFGFSLVSVNPICITNFNVFFLSKQYLSNLIKPYSVCLFKNLRKLSEMCHPVCFGQLHKGVAF